MAKKKTEVVENIVNEVEAQDAVQDTVQEEKVETKIEETKEFHRMTLEEFKEKVTIYYDKLTLVEKTKIVQMVYDNCVKYDEDNGIYYVDNLDKEIALSFCLLSFCTNFYEVDENATIYTYDDLYLNGIFYYLKEKLAYDCEVIVIDDMMNEINYIDRKVNILNSTGACLHRLLNTLLNKMPDINEAGKMIKELPEVLNKVDPKVIEMLGKDLKNSTV